MKEIGIHPTTDSLRNDVLCCLCIILKSFQNTEIGLLLSIGKCTFSKEVGTHYMYLLMILYIFILKHMFYTTLYHIRISSPCPLSHLFPFGGELKTHFSQSFPWLPNCIGHMRLRDGSIDLEVCKHLGLK